MTTPQNHLKATWRTFTYIRAKLLRQARQLAGRLQPGAADINRRALALERALERINWLDQILPNCK